VASEYTFADMPDLYIMFGRAWVDEVVGSRLYQIAHSGRLIPDREMFNSVDRFVSNTEISSFAAEERGREWAVWTREMKTKTWVMLHNIGPAH
jgi:hypothetical protein